MSTAAIRQGQVTAINAAGGEESLTRNTGMRASVNLFGTSAISLGGVSMAAEAGWEKRVVRYTNSRGQQCIRVFFLESLGADEMRLRGDVHRWVVVGFGRGRGSPRTEFNCRASGASPATGDVHRRVVVGWSLGGRWVVVGWSLGGR